MRTKASASPRESRPGAIVLFGSGETGEIGRIALQWLVSEGRAPRVTTVLETPAGFEPNCAEVAARWTESIRRHLPRSDVLQLAMRKRGTPLSPDDAELARPLLVADLIALGAGSPTYAARQLRDTLAWRYLQAAHTLGADLFLASAGAIAAGRYALPVYEIFKVGDDPHWKDGLDLFATYGVAAAIVPHWDNADGGPSLDTSRCFVGQARFDALADALPSDASILGVDDNTALALSPWTQSAHVLGRGSVTVRHRGKDETHRSGSVVSFDLLGLSPRPTAAIPPDLVETVTAARREVTETAVPREVGDLIERRQRARDDGEWERADALREQIARRGWKVEDTKRGPRVRPVKARVAERVAAATRERRSRTDR